MDFFRDSEASAAKGSSREVMKVGSKILVDLKHPTWRFGLANGREKNAGPPIWKEEGNPHSDSNGLANHSHLAVYWLSIFGILQLSRSCRLLFHRK